MPNHLPIYIFILELLKSKMKTNLNFFVFHLFTAHSIAITKQAAPAVLQGPQVRLLQSLPKEFKNPHLLLSLVQREERLLQ
jgi:hypothetical protein